MVLPTIGSRSLLAVPVPVFFVYWFKLVMKNVPSSEAEVWIPNRHPQIEGYGKDVRYSDIF
jgi:hypothetical protein